MNQLTKAAKTLAAKYNSTSLILRIAIGLVVGSVLALICPGAAWIEEFGNLFVGALKGVAPVLVFVIVASALAQGSSKLDRRFGTVVWLYMLTTFVAAALSVVTSKLFPQTLVLAEAATADVVPQGLGDVMHTLLSNIVSNPVASIMNGNYIGILMWACLFGLAMKKLGSDTTKNFMANTADAISTIVRWIINLAPFGIMGLVFTNVSDNGLSIFTQYGRLLLLLVGTMLLMALGNLCIGFVDDMTKIRKGKNGGLTPKQKMIFQTLLALAFSCYCYFHPQVGSVIKVPFFRVEWDLGIWYIPMMMFIIVGTTNSANLLDGLDGLLTSVSMVDFATLAVLCGAASLGSLGVGCAAMCGACMAFLSRNAYPAQMFMGDTGSMFIGGAVVAAAMLLRQPLILVLIAFWMLMSSLSDIIQITYFKKTHGKRIFKMAPIHHHFELCGIHETKIVTMYMVTTAILCVITLLGVL